MTMQEIAEARQSLLDILQQFDEALEEPGRITMEQVQAMENVLRDIFLDTDFMTSLEALDEELIAQLSRAVEAITRGLDDKHDQVSTSLDQWAITQGDETQFEVIWRSLREIEDEEINPIVAWLWKQIVKQGLKAAGVPGVGVISAVHSAYKMYKLLEDLHQYQQTGDSPKADLWREVEAQIGEEARNRRLREGREEEYERYTGNATRPGSENFIPQDLLLLLEQLEEIRGNIEDTRLDIFISEQVSRHGFSFNLLAQLIELQELYALGLQDLAAWYQDLNPAQQYGLQERIATSNSSVEINGGIHIQTQATDAQSIARDMGKYVRTQLAPHSFYTPPEVFHSQSSLRTP